MLNTTEAVSSNTQNGREELVVAFQNFNGMMMAKISNLKGQETYAFGATEKRAEKNARRNYERKYHFTFQNL